MQFQVPYAHIWYGNSNTVYSEGVRAVTTYPPPAAGYFLYYGRTQGQGMHLLFNKNNMAVHYILCVVVYAYATDI